MLYRVLSSIFCCIHGRLEYNRSCLGITPLARTIDLGVTSNAETQTFRATVAAYANT